MRRLVCGLTMLFAFNATGCGSNADKIIGDWAATKFDGKNVAADETLVMEFAPEGKAIVKARKLGKEFVQEGAYRVDGETLITTGKDADGKETTESYTIKILSGDTMVLSRDGKDLELKKKPR